MEAKGIIKSGFIPKVSYIDIQSFFLVLLHEEDRKKDNIVKFEYIPRNRLHLKSNPSVSLYFDLERNGFYCFSHDGEDFTKEQKELAEYLDKLVRNQKIRMLVKA